MAAAVWIWAKQTLPALSSADTANFNAILDYAQRVLTAGPALYLLYPFRLVVRPFLAPDAAAFFIALAPALLIFLLHYLWVIYSDVAFEEASVEASQKLATRIAAVRAGNWQGAKKNQKARRPWFKLAPPARPPRRCSGKISSASARFFPSALVDCPSSLSWCSAPRWHGKAQSHGAFVIVAVLHCHCVWAIRCCWARNCCGWIFGTTCRWRTS